MTLVYSLGIFMVMIPAVLGAKLISTVVFRYHSPIYVTGGIVMILIGIVSLLGIKLPMISLNRTGKQGTDITSIFTLGIFSGITSSCCAPVLAGVLTLSFLSPSLWQALLIGFVYVLGMVTPLYIGSYFLDSKKVLGMNFFKKKITDLKLISKNYPILMGNLISFLIFTLTGTLIIYLTLATDFSMAQMATGFSKGVSGFAQSINKLPGAEYIFGGVILIFVVAVLKHALSSTRASAQTSTEEAVEHKHNEGHECCGHCDDHPEDHQRSCCHEN